jgi:hypothetical protein
MKKAKIAITLPAGDLRRVHDVVAKRRAASVSAYVSSAVRHELESNELADLVAELKRQHGKPARGDYEWARRVLGR